ncbi:MAG: hypothetical protein R3Y27_04055 [Clostridia bacterium]
MIIKKIEVKNKKTKEKHQTKNPVPSPKKVTAVREDFQGHFLECFFYFSFFTEKKKMPFFWLLFLGKQKNVTPLRQQKLHQPHQQTKKQTEIYPQQQTQERQKNQPIYKHKNDNTKPKPLHNQKNCKKWETRRSRTPPLRLQKYFSTYIASQKNYNPERSEPS